MKEIQSDWDHQAHGFLSMEILCIVVVNMAGLLMILVTGCLNGSVQATQQAVHMILNMTELCSGTYTSNVHQHGMLSGKLSLKKILKKTVVIPSDTSVGVLENKRSDTK